MTEQEPTVEDIEREFQHATRRAIARQMASEWAATQRPTCPQAHQLGYWRDDGRTMAPGCSYCGQVR